MWMRMHRRVMLVPMCMRRTRDLDVLMSMVVIIVGMCMDVLRRGVLMRVFVPAGDQSRDGDQE